MDNDALSDSPTELGSLLDALEAEGGEGTSNTPPASPETPPAGQEPAKKEGEPSTPPDGITEPKPKEGAATPPAGQTQSPYPKELEPFKTLFEGKKWDPAKPEWQAEALKTLQEQEQFQGRLTTDLGLTRTHAAELNQALLGSPQDINAFRQRAGHQPLPFEAASLEDKYKAAAADMQLLQDALSDNEQVSRAATQKLVQAFQKKVSDLELDKRIAERTPAKAADNGSQANVNWARILEKDPEANKAMTALVPFLKTKLGSGLLGSFGMDPQNIMSTPERAAQAHDLATRLHRGDPQVFEAEVSKRVKAEMEQNRQRQVAGGVPGGMPASPNHQAASEEEAHLAGMFNRG